MVEQTGDHAPEPRKPCPRGWLARAARLSPALGALSILLVYLIFVPLFINKCSWLNANCTAPQIRAYLVSHELCACDEAGGCAISLDAKARLWPGRFLWVFATGVGLLANLFAIGVALYTIWQLRADRVLRYMLAALPLILCAVFIPIRPMMSQMFELLECTAQADLPFVTRATHAANVFGLAATVCVATASCVVIRAPRGRHQGVSELYALTGRLRALLYAGTCALVIYVLRVSIQANWALAYLPPSPPENKADAPAVLMASLTSAFTSAQAASSTLLLAAIYIPAFIILRSRAVSLADPHMTPKAREDWLKENGLSVSFTEHLPKVAAILGPLIVGPLGELLGRLT
jgi:hypothetical protein